VSRGAARAAAIYLQTAAACWNVSEVDRDVIAI
jgi:hypothetical protein